MRELPQDFLPFVRDVLEPDILPVYRTDYAKGRGEDPYARAVHGCLHISRCLIFSEAMLACYETTMGVPASRFDRQAIRLALAWHDAGREADGVDLWEHESAFMAGDYVQSLGLSTDYAEYVGRLIMHEQRDARDPNAHLVQACDTLDVLRVYMGRAFDRTRLAFLNPSGDPCIERLGPDARTLRDRVIAEAEAWIQYTEGWQVAPRLARLPTCCQDMLEMLKARRDKHPTLSALLQHLE